MIQLAEITLFTNHKTNSPVSLVRRVSYGKEGKKILQYFTVRHVGGNDVFSNLFSALNFIDMRWHRTYWEKDIIKRLDAAEKRPY